MGSLVKKLITTITFRDSVSSSDDIRFLRLRIDDEGCGRFFVLTDESEGCTKSGTEIYLHSPEDFKKLYEAAQELWDQGELYFDSIKELYRVWPDGTVQEVDDGEPYSHMSDDFKVVLAEDGTEAAKLVLGSKQGVGG